MLILVLYLRLVLRTGWLFRVWMVGPAMVFEVELQALMGADVRGTL